MRLAAALLASTLVWSIATESQQLPAASGVAPGTVHAAPSATGARALTEAAVSSAVNLMSYGCRADCVADDTACIKAARDAAVTAYPPRCVYAPRGCYRFSDTVLFVKPGSKVTDGTCLFGDGPNDTRFVWAGNNPNKPALQFDGAGVMLQGFQVRAANDWQAGISWGGRAVGGTGGGRATVSSFRDVWVWCGNYGNTFKGDGIRIGDNGSQADMLEIDHPWLSQCRDGANISSWSQNALAINLISPVSMYAHHGIRKGHGVDVNVFGGFVGYNDIDFVVDIGNAMTVTGVDTEGSRRTAYGTNGYANNSFLYSGNSVRQVIRARKPAKGSITAGQTTLTLNETRDFVEGDFIVIWGAGPSGAPLRTMVTGWTNSGATLTIGDPAATSVTNADVNAFLNCTVTSSGGREITLSHPACVAIGDYYYLVDAVGNLLNTSADQVASCSDSTHCTMARHNVPAVTGGSIYTPNNRWGMCNFVLGQGGPYTFIGNHFNDHACGRMPGAAWINNSFSENVTNPFGYTSYPLPGEATLAGNRVGCKQRCTPMQNRLPADPFVTISTTSGNIADIDASASSFFKTACTQPCTIRQFRNLTPGQTITLWVDDVNTTIDNSALIVTGTGSPLPAARGGVYRFLATTGSQVSRVQ